MSPLLIRRREFTKGLAFGMAMAVSLPLAAQAAPIATQAPATRPARARDLLPPSQRPVDLRCVKCGWLLGTQTLDELDVSAGLACGDCWQELVDENEELENRNHDNADFEADLEDARSELENAQTDLNNAHTDLKHLLGAHDDIEAALWGIADQLPRDSRGYERVRDVLDLLHEAAAGVTVPA